MMDKVYMKLQGVRRTHYQNPNPVYGDYTLCMAAMETDELTDMVFLGDAPDSAKVTCEDCLTTVRACYMAYKEGK